MGGWEDGRTGRNELPLVGWRGLCSVGYVGRVTKGECLGQQLLVAWVCFALRMQAASAACQTRRLQAIVLFCCGPTNQPARLHAVGRDSCFAAGPAARP